MSLSPGTRLGKYSVRRKLAEGGMAEIFLCAAEGPEGFAKDVVVKRVRPFLTDDPAFISMFIDEARLASRLTHPNVVQIFDFDRHGDTYYLAMEYVRGASLWELRERCRAQGRSMPPLLVAHIGVEVSRALSYAHQLTDGANPLNVVHRDVTPHNVLISYEGAVKLGDFGIARAGKASTAPGMLKGKFAYMSPEQARGEAVDGRCDVFALGVVLWELLTGGRPFEAESDLGVLRAVQQRVIPPPRRLNPEVPEALDAAVMRALERDLERRWPDARSFGRAIEQVVMTHQQTPEDTDIAAFLLEVLGPPPPTSSEVPRPVATAGDTGPNAPGETSGSLPPASAATPAPSAPTPPGISLDDGVPSPQWGVSEPTPALRRRSTPGAPAAAFLLDGTRARGIPDGATEGPLVFRTGGDGDAQDPGRDATLALKRDTPAEGAPPTPQLLRTPPRPKAGRIAVVCISALVMAGPAIFLMNRVMREESGKGVATATLHAKTAPAGGAGDATRVAEDLAASTSSGSRTPAGDAPEVRENDLSERAPSLAAQSLVTVSDVNAGATAVRAPRSVESEADVAALQDDGAAVATSREAGSATERGGLRSPRERAPASVRGTGVLVIEVFPEAQLEINGQARGRVRGRQSFRLPLGPHTVHLVHPHRSERFEIDLSKESRATLRFNAFHLDPR